MKREADEKVLSEAERLIDEKNYEEAMSLLRSHNFSDELDADLLVAYSKYKLEMFEGAIECFCNIESKYGLGENSLYIRGNCYLEIGELNLAKVDFNKVLSINPNTFDAFVGLGVIKESEGDSTEAIEFYRKALILNPSSSVARSRLEAIEI